MKPKVPKSRNFGFPTFRGRNNEVVYLLIFRLVFITELTGITNEMLSQAPKADEVIKEFADYLGNDVLIGYNVGFDINFL